MNCNLDYFNGLVKTINKKWGYNLSIELKTTQIELKSQKGRIYGTDALSKMESALKSLKNTGIISHYCFEERKEYQSFIKDKVSAGIPQKIAHKEYFLNLL